MTLFPTARRGRGRLRRAAVLIAAAAVALPAIAADLDERGFIGLVEGYAVVQRADVIEMAMEEHELLDGDQLTTGSGGRVELVLAGDVAVYVEADSELRLASFTAAGTGDLSPLLLLEYGELLLTREDATVTATRVDTDNATLYLDDGACRIERFDESTRVVVRRGEAELRTPHGVMTVKAGEEAVIEGDGLPVVAMAGDQDALEQWVAALGDRGDRWAACGGRPCSRRFVVEPESTVFHSCDFTVDGLDDWDGGGTVHEPGRARRTRPPHPDDPGQRTGGDGRVAVPIDREPPVVADNPVVADDPPEPSSPVFDRAHTREIVGALRDLAESTPELSSTEASSLPDPRDLAEALANVARNAEPVDAPAPAAEPVDAPAATFEPPSSSPDPPTPDPPPPPDTGSTDVAPIEAPAVADPGGEPNRE